MSTDPWHWDDTQTEAITTTFERLQQQIAEAQDAMVDGVSTAVEQLPPAVTRQRARQALQQAHGHLCTLSGLADLTEAERRQWSPLAPLGAAHDPA